jgi:segregation and condensation protein B
MVSKERIKSVMESLMFIWGEPVNAGDAAKILSIKEKEAMECFLELKREYEEKKRGLRIRRVDRAFQFVSAEENAEYIERFCRPVKTRSLSQAALEVLAIVAYRQPVTKPDIDSVRGIRSDRVLEGLREKGLVEELGKADTIGHPVIYGTTDKFLKEFGFESLEDLPDIGDVMEMSFDDNPDSSKRVEGDFSDDIEDMQLSIGEIK